MTVGLAYFLFNQWFLNFHRPDQAWVGEITYIPTRAEAQADQFG